MNLTTLHHMGLPYAVMGQDDDGNVDSEFYVMAAFSLEDDAFGYAVRETWRDNNVIGIQVVDTLTGDTVS